MVFGLSDYSARNTWILVVKAREYALIAFEAIRWTEGIYAALANPMGLNHNHKLGIEDSVRTGFGK